MIGQNPERQGKILNDSEMVGGKVTTTPRLGVRDGQSCSKDARADRGRGVYIESKQATSHNNGGKERGSKVEVKITKTAPP